MNKSKLINIRISEELLNNFNNYCQENNTNKSKVLTQYIQSLVNQNQNDIEKEKINFDLETVETLIDNKIDEKLESLMLITDLAKLKQNNKFFLSKIRELFKITMLLEKAVGVDSGEVLLLEYTEAKKFIQEKYEYNNLFKKLKLLLNLISKIKESKAPINHEVENLKEEIKKLNQKLLGFDVMRNVTKPIMLLEKAVGVDSSEFLVNDYHETRKIINQRYQENNLSQTIELLLEFFKQNQSSIIDIKKEEKGLTTKELYNKLGISKSSFYTKLKKGKITEYYKKDDKKWYKKDI